MDIVRKIIRAYLYNPMPEKVQRQFRSWCLREEGSHEKTEALREEWERLDPAAVLPTDEEAYRGKLARLHGEMRPPLRLRHDPGSRRRAAAVAAAVVVLAMSVEFFVVRHLTADSTTVLVTAENSKGRFTLPDGSVVWLNADSRLAYSNRFVDSEKREVRLEGEAFFDVRRDTLRPFEVTMGDLEVRVLGTRFNGQPYSRSRNRGGHAAVGQRRGRTRRFPRDGAAPPPTRLRLRHGVGAAGRPKRQGQQLRQLDGRFDRLRQHDAGGHRRHLEHWYNIRIRIDDGVDASTRISFTLRPETLDETLRIIENLTHFACERTDRQHITIRKR